MALEFPVNGFDVSFYQRDIDWEIARKRVGFAFIKATQSTSIVDFQFLRNWQESKRVGIPRAAYHYFYPKRTPVLDAKSQAEHFFGVMESTGDLGEMLPMMDCESDPALLSLSEMEDRITKFIDRLKVLSGKDAIVYTRKTWWNAQVTNQSLSNTDIPHVPGDGMRLLMVAQYNPIIRVPAIPWDWEKRYGPNAWTFWQHSADGNNKGALYGAKSDDIDLDRFNGTAGDFKALFGVEPADVTVPPPVEPKTKVFTVGVINPRTKPVVDTLTDAGTIVSGKTFVKAGLPENGFQPVVLWLSQQYLKEVN